MSEPITFLPREQLC